MKKLFFILALIFLSIMTNAQQTPLLDRDLFFGNPEIAAGQLSPDGLWISFMKEYNGIMNIWVKKFDEPFEKAKPLTDSPRPLYGYFWTNDSKYILYVKDKDGDENINIFAVNPSDANGDGKIPASRNLTPMKDIRASINMVSKKDPNILMVGINDRDKAWHDLYQLNISDGKLTKIYENIDRVTGYDFDWDEKLRVLSKTDEKGNTIMYKIDEKNQLTPIYETNVNEQAYITGWNEDNSLAYLVTNKGDLNLSSLFTLNPNNKELTKIESDPLNKVDIASVFISDKTRKLTSTAYVDDKRRRYYKDKIWEDRAKFLEQKFPNREIGFSSMTEDEKKFLVDITGDIYAPEIYFYNSDTNDLIFQYTPRPKLKEVEKYLSPMTPISYKSKDGLEIPAYLTIPTGSSGKNLPVVVLVHGGPKGPRDYWGYNPQVQFLANRGYAVLQPNFRASGGYGKNFLNKGDKQWGKLMQDDITYGAKYLIDKGIADKTKVGIMGGSYGGYATLAGLAFTPELYACGVDIVGPSNIFTLLESVPAYWEAGRAFLYGMVGDPNTEEGKKLIKEASPLFSADKIVKPLLIIQGANDPRVKKAEAEQIVIALRDKGKKVEYLLADDEGHGFAKPVNRMAMFAEIEEFLSEILGGRYQKEMPEDVSKRLKELTVDVKTVKYEPQKTAKVSTELPIINNTLKEGKQEYSMTLEVQGQTIPFEMIRTITKKGDNYLISDDAKTPMGEMKDEVELTKDFKLVSRNITQMGMKIPMTMKDNTLMVEMQGKQTPIKFNGIYLSDGAGLDYIIAGLPLKKDYELIFEMADIMKMKTKTMTLKVKEDEKIGEEICKVVEISNNENPMDKTVYWISPSQKLAVKAQQTIPEMGNGKMTIIKK